MRNEHVEEKLSAYLNDELTKDERQTIAAHLLQCEHCRKEHETIKFGVSLASCLRRSDAPPSVWNAIENALESKNSSWTFSISQISLLNSRRFIATALLLGCGLIATIYFGLNRNASPEIANNDSTIQQTFIETPQVAMTPAEISTNRNTDVAQISPSIDTDIQKPSSKTNAKILVRPQSNRTTSARIPAEKTSEANDLPAWAVDALAGSPTAGSKTIAENGKLFVGQFLETDANSSARVQVANIGEVEVAPNSRLRLIKTESTEHRLSLERGRLKATIIAPPRLFIVDTPSAVAVDLGCEYTLEVDEDGNSKLHVTAGFVALERDGHESIVPAGAICLTKKGKGLGTPFSADASKKLQDAIFRFDFQTGGSEALNSVIEESNVYDALTLWHLLARVPETEREKVFDRLESFVNLPADATKKGVLQLNKKMLDRWWTEIENLWFE